MSNIIQFPRTPEERRRIIRSKKAVDEALQEEHGIRAITYAVLQDRLTDADRERLAASLDPWMLNEIKKDSGDGNV